MTKFNTILLFALIVGIASARVTNLETMKAWNFFRQHPGVVASWIEKKYISKGINGVYKDTNCYKNAITALNKQKPAAPLTESVGADLAATSHARYLLKENKGQLSHDGKDRPTKTMSKRLSKFGKFVASYKVAELMTAFNQEELVAANDILLHFVTDCNNEAKDNLSTVYAPVSDFTHAGVGIAVVGDQTLAVLMMTKSYSSNPVKNAVLTAFELEGNADYFGKGETMPSTSVKTSDAFTHNGKEIYPELNPSNVAKENVKPLFDLVDDKSVACPTWINPSNVKNGGYMQDWALTSKTCVRGTGAFKTTNNLDRVAPFAKNGSCYHRLSYCSDQGTIWVKDREYNTLENVDAGAAHTPKTAILKNFVNDKSTDCPPFVNGDLLRKRFVQDWYLNGSDCTVGAGNFDKNGFNSPLAIAMQKKCFHRVQFCDSKGRTWVRDSEYKTLAEYRAEQH